ncbi:MAG: M56 family metallopeptidase [Longimicrobiales bacterium]
MIAAWMAYALLVAALAAGAAGILESLFRAHRKPVRWIWMGAMAFASLWPLWLALAPEAASGSATSRGHPVVAMDPLIFQVGSGSFWHVLETPLLVGWIGASLLLAGFGLTLLLRTVRLRRGWVGSVTRGRTVLLSDDWGPAVVGFFNPQIVLPHWCQALEGEGLSLILDHEAEHLRAGDLRLLMLAGIPPILLPWSLPLWWMWYRLRLAVEGDCDLRVLRKNPRATRAYLELLLEVGRRFPRSGMATAMLSEPEKTLERRIKIMTMPFPKKPILRGAILVTVGSILVAVACWAPTPTAVEEETALSPVKAPEATTSREVAAGPVFTPYTVRPDIRNRSEIARVMEESYPPLLRDAGISGTATVWFFLDETGSVQEAQINESSGHQALDAAALRVARDIEFTPALNGDEPVPVWISLPITFTTR